MDDAKFDKLPKGYFTACGGRIYEPERYASVTYRGRQVFFCSKSCLLAYQADPDRFMSGEIDHPLEPNQD
jgi:YHS domain-containing protein